GCGRGRGDAKAAALHRLRGAAAPVPDVAVLAGEREEPQDLGARRQALARRERRQATLYPREDRVVARRRGLAAEPADFCGELREIILCCAAAQQGSGRFELRAGADEQDAVVGLELFVGAGVDDARAAALDADDAGAGEA